MSFLRNPGKRMRRAAALLLVLVFALSLPPAAAFAAGELTEGEELLKNGDFSDPLLFQLYKESGGAAAISIVDGQLQVDVSAIGRVAHAIQPYYDGFGLVQGVEYELSYDVRSTLPRELYVRVQLNGGDYHAYEGAFAWAVNLSSVSLPSTLGSIGEYAFYHCDDLTSVTIPDSVTSIGEKAFNKCESLTVAVSRNSYAMQYCGNNGINYVYQDANE